MKSKTEMLQITANYIILMRILLLNSSTSNITGLEAKSLQKKKQQENGALQFISNFQHFHYNPFITLHIILILAYQHIRVTL